LFTDNEFIETVGNRTSIEIQGKVVDNLLVYVVKSIPRDIMGVREHALGHLETLRIKNGKNHDKIKAIKRLKTIPRANNDFAGNNNSPLNHPYDTKFHLESRSSTPDHSAQSWVYNRYPNLSSDKK
jgi:hypothetical protein